MDAIWNGFNEGFEERCGGSHIRFFDEFYDGELGSPVDGDKQVELAFGGPHLGQIDVKEADRIGVELLPPGLVAFV